MDYGWNVKLSTLKRMAMFVGKEVEGDKLRDRCQMGRGLLYFQFCGPPLDSG